jgi:hypothetical protein
VGFGASRVGVGKGVGFRDVRVTPHECEHRGGVTGWGALGQGPSRAPPTSGAGAGRRDQTLGDGEIGEGRKGGSR